MATLLDVAFVVGNVGFNREICVLDRSCKSARTDDRLTETFIHEIYGEYKYTPLMAACQTNQIDRIDYLVYCGANIQEVNEFGENALFAAAYGCANKIALKLIEMGIDWKRLDKNGANILTYCCNYDMEETALRLIDLGIDVNIKPFVGFRALTMAKKYGSHKLINSLIEAGARP